jgi:outer membrane receptor protein involved in Fe transport
MENSFGDLPNDRRHSVKLFGMYAFDSGFQVGGNFAFSTGTPINGFGMHPTDPWAQWYGALAFYNNGEPCPRGCGGRTPDVWKADLLLRYDLKRWGSNWYVRLDTFNLFNNAAVVAVDEDAQSINYQPNPNYGGATYYQPPRSVRLGLGMSF